MSETYMRIELAKIYQKQLKVLIKFRFVAVLLKNHWCEVSGWFC